MGILKNIFNNNNNTSKLEFGWNYLEEISAIDKAVELSENITIIIFKHSTRCGISSSVLRKFENQMKSNKDNYSFYMIKVVENRNISNELAKRFAVQHESPQVLIIKNKAVQKYGSHYDILGLEF